MTLKITNIYTKTKKNTQLTSFCPTAYWEECWSRASNQAYKYKLSDNEVKYEMRQSSTLEPI